jgi:hypothetical protein
MFPGERGQKAKEKTMSCFLMEERAIAGLAAEIVKLHLDKLPLRGDGNPHDGESLADAMLAMNIDALRQRYGNMAMLDDMEHVNLDARAWNPLDAFTPVQFYKSLECFLYQCAEGNVDERPLYKAIQTLHSSLVVKDMRGYSNAVWG